MIVGFKAKEVDIDDDIFHVHELSVKHRREVFAETENKDSGDSMKTSAMLILYGCHEFKDQDFAAIDDLPGSYFDKLSSAVAEISGMVPEDECDEKKPENS